MKFNESFDKYMGLYNEGLWANINAKKKRGGKPAHGNSDAHKKAVKAGDKLEKGKSSDEEAKEDCETCGCEENPEYGHLDDTYSNYIDQYEPKEDCETCGCEDAEAGCECGNCPDCTPKEDNEYDMGEVLDGIAADFANDMTKSELEAKYGTDAVAKFIKYGDEDGLTASEDAEDREFFFGYDLENVHPVQEFIKANYKEGEYEMSIGHGDEVMNHLKVNVDLDDERGRKLLYMIEDCDGEGNYDEDDYEEDAEGKIDKDRMKCNKPRRTSGGSKKFVVKACENGKEKVVRFGDPKMKIKKSNPKRRKSFRARHKCDQKKSKFSAGYWSCKKW